jgi:hypothetical protein
VQYVATQDEQALRTQLDQARERLDGLLENLRGVDGEIASLASEREQFQLLDAVCAGLEELDALGASELFWSGAAAAGSVQEHVHLARGRVDAFQEKLGAIEARRQQIVDEIERVQESTDFIEDDLFEVRREAELRKLEWVPERQVEAFPIHASRMPWSRAGVEDWLFRKVLVTSILVNFLLGSVLPMIDLPLPEPWEELEVPDRLTRLITAELPPPPPPVPQEAIAQKPKPTEELASKEVTPSPNPDWTPEPAAGSKGILAFREKFSGLAENDPGARLGANARIDDSGGGAPGWATRNMVSTKASGSSGGINLASLSRNVGGQGGDGIAGVQVGRATSSIGSGGGGGSGRPMAGGGPGPARTDEEIQIVFDRHKAALYRLYNRELRRDPTLQGQMVLRLRIEPDGRVSLCELQSSDMRAPQLSAQVVDRVRSFDFGAKQGVPTVTILYPIDFLPAA